MVVYVDILVCLNTVITYLILLATEKISRVKSKNVRILSASLIGGISSLYIFLPQQYWAVELIVKLAFSAAITVTAFKIACLRVFLRTLIVFYAVSFMYAGSMVGIWYAFKPDSMVINNGVVYFSISPIVLIFSTAVCYLLLRLVQTVFKTQDKYSINKRVYFINGNKKVACNCMVDTGCSVGDSVGGCRVAIIEREAACDIFSREEIASAIAMSPAETIKNVFRVIPYKTLTSSGVLPALKVDGAVVDGKDINKVLVCIQDVTFDGDFTGIISPAFYGDGG